MKATIDGIESLGRSLTMTVDEVALYLRIHRSTVYRLVRAGVIPGVKVGSQWRFQKELVDRWMAAQHAALTERQQTSPSP